MSAYILIEKLNYSFHHMTAQLSRVLRTILVLSCAHRSAHASVSGHLNTGWSFCDQQRELTWKCSRIQKGVLGGGYF
jgi:hypothetical protein